MTEGQFALLIPLAAAGLFYLLSPNAKDNRMLQLKDISFGALAHDRVTRICGTVTAKLERASGMSSVCLEGADTTGRAFCEWVDLDRLELDA